MRRLRHARRTGPVGQEKDKGGKCEVERRDQGKKRKRRHDPEETKGRRGPSRPGGRRRHGVGGEPGTTGVSFLNLLGVCGSNKDKGGNDYSVKSMVLDCANTN